MKSVGVLTEGKICWLGRKTPTRCGNVELTRYKNLIKIKLVM